MLTVQFRRASDGLVPAGAAGHFICVVLSEHFKELVEDNRKEADYDMNPLHTQEALRRQYIYIYIYILNISIVKQ